MYMATRQHGDSSQHLIENLKKDVEVLQRKLTQPDAQSQELILEIESMKDAVHELNIIFQKALEEVKSDDIGRLIKDLSKNIGTLIDQNETIAKGMIALSEKVDRAASSGRMPQMPPRQHSMSPPPQMGGNMQRMAPRPSMPSFSSPTEAYASASRGMDLPPPPPGGRKGGLF
jgi:C-terminal processing protease CtpA/Prc